MFKIMTQILLISIFCLSIASCEQQNQTATTQENSFQPIKVLSPERPKGQKDVLGLVTRN